MTYQLIDAVVMAYMVLHMAIAVFALIISNVKEFSIITDRINKYLFMGASVVYSFLAPQLFKAVCHPYDINYHKISIIALLGFVLIQTLVYRLLNRVEIAD
ncbi:hypothetical protein [Falsibacillus albus]|uniref:Uncharacterized protein n=1 Tax=Falsibacillus albus TaxID=2478915 RepID=A0A3L7JPJ6_9BACI|nr:hypothetical protein [Falsibacillus albus]RLQ92400.1 hypothetical protein D9X91_19315 [Falsibacillus albus]